MLRTAFYRQASRVGLSKGVHSALQPCWPKHIKVVASYCVRVRVRRTFSLSSTQFCNEFTNEFGLYLRLSKQGIAHEFLLNSHSQY